MLEQARNTLKSLDEFYLSHKDGSDELKGEVDEVLTKNFYEKMANDFDVAGALGVIFEWMNGSPKNIQGSIERINQVLQIFPTTLSLPLSKPSSSKNVKPHVHLKIGKPVTPFALN